MSAMGSIKDRLALERTELAMGDAFGPDEDGDFWLRADRDRLWLLLTADDIELLTRASNTLTRPGPKKKKGT